MLAYVSLFGRGATDAFLSAVAADLAARGLRLAGTVQSNVDRGMPVLVGVNALNLPDFLAFADGLAMALPPDVAAVADWASIAARASAA